MWFSPVPNGPHNPVAPLSQEKICRQEEEQLKRKKEAKKRRRRRRKNNEEQVQKQRKLVKERRAEQVLELEKDEERWWEETERRWEEEEARRRKEAMGRKEEIRRQEENLRRNLQAVMEDEEKQLEERLEEANEWREKVREEEEEEKEMEEEKEDARPPKPEEEEDPGPSHARPPAGTQDELKTAEEAGEMAEGQRGFPAGCLVSDVAAACERLRLAAFPPVSSTQLKALSLEGESPTHAGTGTHEPSSSGPNQPPLQITASAASRPRASTAPPTWSGST